MHILDFSLYTLKYRVCIYIHICIQIFQKISFSFCGKNYKNFVYYQNSTAGRVVANTAALKEVMWYTSGG